MKKKKIEMIFASDTDVLFYGAVNKFYDQHIANRNFDAALCIPDQEFNEFRWVASGHTSFVSLTFLESFCVHILDIYTNKPEILSAKIDFHTRSNFPGGINDMTFFYLYYYNINNRIFNLSADQNGSIFNINIDLKDSERKNKIHNNIFHAQVSFSNNLPFATDGNGQNIFFESLHLHGGSKYLMLKFYRGYTDVFVFKLKVFAVLKNFIGKIKKQK